MPRYKHGHTLNRVRTRAYRTWEHMRERCNSPTHPNWHRYGGRGIYVCERWNQFENFLADMGEPPPGMSLERIDNDGPYSPTNCRWATQLEQKQNTSTTRRLEHNGEVRCVAEWARIKGMHVNTLWYRLKLGWDADRALTEPLSERHRRVQRHV